MHFLFWSLGCIAAIILMAAGVGYVFAPGAMRRLLQTAGTAAGLIFFALLVVCNLARAAGPVGSILAVAAMSAAAYSIRARRTPHAASRQWLRNAERTPVMPRHLGDGL